MTKSGWLNRPLGNIDVIIQRKAKNEEIEFQNTLKNMLHLIIIRNEEEDEV